MQVQASWAYLNNCMHENILFLKDQSNRHQKHLEISYPTQAQSNQNPPRSNQDPLRSDQDSQRCNQAPQGHIHQNPAKCTQYPIESQSISNPPRYNQDPTTKLHQNAIKIHPISSRPSRSNQDPPKSSQDAPKIPSRANQDLIHQVLIKIQLSNFTKMQSRFTQDPPKMHQDPAFDRSRNCRCILTTRNTTFVYSMFHMSILPLRIISYLIHTRTCL